MTDLALDSDFPTYQSMYSVNWQFDMSKCIKFLFLLMMMQRF